MNHQSLELIGTKGRVELVIPFNAPADTATALLVALAGIVRRWSSYTAAAAELVAAVQLVIWGVLRRTGLERAILPDGHPERKETRH